MAEENRAGGGAKKAEEKLSPGDSFKLDLYFWLQALVMALAVLILLFTFVGRVITPIVKRVIAVGGDHVEIDYAAGTVKVNGKALDEDYIKEPMVRPGDPDMGNEDVWVPEGHIYVMGDNRNDSSDSRHVELGPVDQRQVLGRVLFVLLPAGHFGAVK